MDNRFEQTFTFPALLRFSLSNIVMMIFMSLYVIVDGMFVSRFVNTTALSAINMTYPIECIEFALGIMLTSGGSAIIARKMGEGKAEEARQDFTFLVMVSLIVGVSIALICNLFMESILDFLGVSAKQHDYCALYTRILTGFAPCLFLQSDFQMYFITAGKPQLGLALTVAAGVENMIMDYVFIVPLHMGILGAALATVLGYCIPAVTGLLYFSLKRDGSLYFVPFPVRWNVLRKSCTNGISEMISNLSMAVTTFLFNILFMKYYGEDGVAAITIVMYFQFVYTSIYFGYAMGIAPVISYKFGSGATEELRKMVRSSICFLVLCSAASWLLSLLTIRPLLILFAEPGNGVFELTLQGFRIFAISFLFMGISLFASSLFTAVSDGRTSAVISFLRTLIFLSGSILALQAVFGGPGLWYAVPLAELLGLLVSVWYLIRKKTSWLPDPQKI